MRRAAQAATIGFGALMVYQALLAAGAPLGEAPERIRTSDLRFRRTRLKDGAATWTTPSNDGDISRVCGHAPSRRTATDRRACQRDPGIPCGACCADTLSTHSRCLTTSRDRHWRPPMTSVPRPQTEVFQPKGPSYRERSMAGLTLTMEVLYQLS